MNKLTSFILLGLLLIFNNAFANELTCNVTATSANGTITVIGMDSNTNTKLFTADYTTAWECNPWFGSPCSTNEVITGLTVGTTYYLSVQSDNCSEWIPITVQGNTNCEIEGTITNCTSNNAGFFTYDLNVTNPAGGTYLVYLYSVGSGPFTQELAYNQTHTISETGFANEFKYVEDVTNPDCNTQIYFTCDPVDSEVTIPNCPENITVELPLDGGNAMVSWTEPYCNSTCAGDGSICFTNQTVGPANGTSLPEGTYAVVYEAQDGCNNTATCEFTIDVVGIGSECNVDYLTTANGEITVVGLTSSANSKLFTSDFTVVWGCNPWNGTPCSDYEVISGLSTGETYYLSVQSDVCDEWIPITLETIGSCELQGTISNCIYNNISTTTYDIFVSGTNTSGNTFSMQVYQPVVGLQTIELEYNTTHTIGELLGGNSISRVIWDTNNPDCTSTLTAPCQPFESEVVLTNCPQDFNVILFDDTIDEYVSWTAPGCNSTCAGDAQMCFVTQTSGPTNGSFLTAGTYTVTYETGDGCGNTDTCSFDITVSPEYGGANFLECPENVVILIPEGSNEVNVSWDFPTCTFPDGCPPNAQICNTTQTAGPEYGDLVTAGEYTVSYLATSGCGGDDNCSFNISVQEGGDPCPINAVESSPAVIYISGLTADANVKIFDTDYNIIWDCNPWNGNPCNFEEYYGTDLGYLNTYFVSVVTDQCEEWFPITIQAGQGCSLDAQISNCVFDANLGVIYDILVNSNNNANGQFEMAVTLPDGTPSSIALDYGVVHTITDAESTSIISKTIFDTNNSSCNTTVTSTCNSLDNCELSATVSNVSCTPISVTYDLLVTGIHTTNNKFAINLQAGFDFNTTEFELNQTHTITEYLLGGEPPITERTIQVYDPILLGECFYTLTFQCANDCVLDTDGDGTCDEEDCEPTNPFKPTIPGTTCSDGDFNTINDVIQADGCTCMGTPTTTCANGSTNLALGALTSQSSTLTIGGITAASDLAVDGNTDGNFYNGSVAATQEEYQAWWEIDLGAIATIELIEIYNKTNGNDQLIDYYYMISDTPFDQNGSTATNLEIADFSKGKFGVPSSYSFTQFEQGIQGRYIRIQLEETGYCTFAELVVTGCVEPINHENNLHNLATNSKTANLFSIQSVFPNPVNQSAFVKIASEVEEEFSLEIYNLTGQLKQHINVNIEKGNNTLELDTHHLNAGIYNIFLKNTKGQTKSVRFVKIND